MRSVRLQSLIVFAGYVLGGFALYWGLPEQVSPSWTTPSGGTVWLGTPLVAFLLPTAAGVTDLLLRGLCAGHPIDALSSINVLAIYDAIMLRFTMFVMTVHAAVLLAMLGLLFGQEWAARIVPLMLGLTMISIGNLLPRTRPNLAIGIRTPRTLSDRSLWITTHRLAGYVTVASGAVVVVAAMVVPSPIGPGIILLVGPAALVATWLLVRSLGRHAHV